VDYQSPAEALNVSAPGPNDGEENETIVSYWDYVRPELVDLYVTNE
jgi:translation initiation factor 2B subunit (eIF-2B alpha/beta/delta family)